MNDPFQLQRFVNAQEDAYEQALEELRAGRKHSHWMWFIFPQLEGLSRSATAQRYAIRSIEEARAYVAHPLLGMRLRQAVEATLAWAGKRDAESIFGGIDSAKLRSSLTLFEAASGDALFARAIDAFFQCERDAATLRLLRT